MFPQCHQHPRWIRSSRVLVALCALVAFVPEAKAEASGFVPDIPVRTIDGREATLSELWSQRPLLITLFYTRCVGVCSPYLLSLAETIAANGGVATAYNVLALSFDPDDDEEAVRDYARRMGLVGKPGWHVATAAPRDVSALADALGFWYRPDAARGQFDHPALTGAITMGGRVVRILEGIPVNPRAFRETLWELRGNFVPTYAMPNRNTLLSCFDYDPVTGRARPNWGLLVLVTPALVAFAVSVLIFARSPKTSLPKPDKAPT